MQQKWWLFAAGAVGIVLAVLLFPRPDTGGSMSGADPHNTQPLNFKEEPARPVVTRPGVEGARMEPRVARRSLDEERPGPNPMAAELMNKRNTPEAIFAGRASGPWTIVRRQLMLMPDDPAAAAFAEELAELITDLRSLRRDPEAGSYADLDARQRDLLQKARANTSWAKDDVLVSSLERVDGVLGEYKEAGNDPSAQE